MLREGEPDHVECERERELKNSDDPVSQLSNHPVAPRVCFGSSA
jgi:hypothetical protein